MVLRAFNLRCSRLLPREKDGLIVLAGEVEGVDSTIDTDLVARAKFIIPAFGGEYLDWIRGGLGPVDNLLSQARGSVRVFDDLVARRTIIVVREEAPGF